MKEKTFTQNRVKKKSKYKPNKLRLWWQTIEFLSLKIKHFYSLRGRRNVVVFFFLFKPISNANKKNELTEKQMESHTQRTHIRKWTTDEKKNLVDINNNQNNNKIREKIIINGQIHSEITLGFICKSRNVYSYRTAQAK